MTYPVWPSELPQRVLADSFSLGAADGRLMPQMPNNAPPPVRRRITGATRTASCSVVLEQPYAARLLRFRNETLEGATLPFLIPDQQNDGWPLLDENYEALTDENGEELLDTAWWLVRFGSQWSQSSRGVDFMFAFDLVILPGGNL